MSELGGKEVLRWLLGGPVFQHLSGKCSTLAAVSPALWAAGALGCAPFFNLPLLWPCSSVLTPKGKQIWTEQVPFLTAATATAVPDHSLSSYQFEALCPLMPSEAGNVG